MPMTITELDGVPIEHKRAQIGDVALHYVEAGKGPTVVLLHGFPEFWYSWRKQIPALVRAGFRVLAPDLRGYNESDKPEGVDRYRVVELARDVAGFMTQSGDAPCALVGHDWGGIIGWFVPMMHPGVVSKLVILNAPHPVPLARELRRSMQQKLRLAYQLLLRAPVFAELLLRIGLGTLMRTAGKFTPDEIRVYAASWKKPGARKAMADYYRALGRSRRELRQLIRPIDLPTMLIWGAKDPVFMRASSENFTDWVPNLRTERLPEAGHFVQTDAADQVSRLLIDFLR